MTPEEDKWLQKSVTPQRCVHSFLDLGPVGIYKFNRDKGCMAFYCKKCLLIRVRTFDQSMFLKDDEED